MNLLTIRRTRGGAQCQFEGIFDLPVSLKYLNCRLDRAHIMQRHSVSGPAYPILATSWKQVARVKANCVQQSRQPLRGFCLVLSFMNVNNKILKVCSQCKGI